MMNNQRGRTRLNRLAAFLLFVMVGLSACGGEAPTAQISATIPVSSPTLAPSPTPSPVPPKVLKVCVAEDPGNLFTYADASSRALSAVIAAIYDDPFEQNPLGMDQPAGILSQVPSQQNGAIRFEPVPVSAGMMVADAYGNPTVLKAGLLVRPAGCEDGSCAVAWDGSAGFMMDQESISYAFDPNARWSDGQPLSAGDSVFAFQVAQALVPQSKTWVMDRTADYQSPDGTAVVWTGIPGFRSQDAAAFFWNPLPAAVLASNAIENLADMPEASLTPLGWGPYRFGERDASSLTLEKNPFYAHAAEGLPAFDQLIFVIQPDREQAIAGLTDGSCDVLDGSYALEQLGVEALTALAQSVSLHWQGWDAVEQLVFGITPVSYDDGYSAWSGERPDYFGDPRTRQAILGCLNPTDLAAEVLSHYLPSGTSLDALGLPTLAGDPQALLTEVGWALPAEGEGGFRVALGVANVLDGTKFDLTLLTGQSALARDVAQAIVTRLGQCGISVSWQSMPVEQLYAPGPEGFLFGRQFDLALVSWQAGLPGCALYASDSIPNERNFWIGTNLAGFADPAFDLACAKAREAESSQTCLTCVGLEPAFPAIPLLPHLIAWASRPGLVPDGVTDLGRLEIFSAP